MWRERENHMVLFGLFGYVLLEFEHLGRGRFIVMNPKVGFIIIIPKSIIKSSAIKKHVMVSHHILIIY